MEINTDIKTDKKVIKQTDRSLDPQKEKKVKKGPGVSDSKNDGQGVDIVPTADYKINAAGKKYRAHRIVFNKGEDDGRKGVTEQMKKTFNTFVSQHTPELTEEELKELDEKGYDRDREEIDSEEDEEKGKSGYEYLLRLQIGSITAEKINKLQNDIDSNIQERDLLKSKSEKDLWLEDLEKFETEYKKWLLEMDKETKTKKVRK